MHLRRRRPDVALHRELRRPEDPDPAPDPLGGRQRPVRGRREVERRLLTEIVDQEISPELIPTKEGEKPQSTEGTIGPYALHDFTLFHVLRFGFRPSKIAFLAEHAWRDATSGSGPRASPTQRRIAYDLPEIRAWLEVFLKRFFASQFKRSAMPNGPKVSAGGSLSPRGDWRMPSDASAAAWLAELDAHVPAGLSQ